MKIKKKSISDEKEVIKKNSKIKSARSKSHFDQKSKTLCRLPKIVMITKILLRYMLFTALGFPTGIVQK